MCNRGLLVVEADHYASQNDLPALLTYIFLTPNAVYCLLFFMLKKLQLYHYFLCMYYKFNI